MKKDEQMLVLFVSIGVAMFWYISRKATGTGIVSSGAKSGYTNEIFVPNDTANGWKYYDDGTAVSPDGKYYQGGKLIWSPS